MKKGGEERRRRGEERWRRRRRGVDDRSRLEEKEKRVGGEKMRKRGV